MRSEIGEEYILHVHAFFYVLTEHIFLKNVLQSMEKYCKVPVWYRPNAASGSVAVGGVRIISALSQAV